MSAHDKGISKEKPSSLSINPRLVKAQAHVLQAQNHLELQRHQIDVKMRSFGNQNDDKKEYILIILSASGQALNIRSRRGV